MWAALWASGECKVCPDTSEHKAISIAAEALLNVNLHHLSYAFTFNDSRDHLRLVIVVSLLSRDDKFANVHFSVLVLRVLQDRRFCNRLPRMQDN